MDTIQKKYCKWQRLRHIWNIPFIVCVWAVVQPSLMAVEAQTSTQQRDSAQTTHCHVVNGMKKLISELSDIGGEWKILGEDLGIPNYVIDRIQIEEYDTETKRLALLRWWYDSQEQLCWEPVIAVLRGMRRNRLAGEIENCIAKGCDCELVECSKTLEDIQSEIERVIKEKDSIDQILINGVLVGLPHVGKSTLLKRFFGRLSTPNVTSTGVASATIQVHISNIRTSDATIQVSGLTWNKMDLDDEIAQLIREIHEAPPSKAATPEQRSSVTIPSLIHSFFNSFLHFFSNTYQDNSNEADPPRTLTNFLNKSIQKNKRSKVKRLLGKPWTLHLTDTGGQPEFQQLLPALVFGPSLFFLVFRLDVDLDEFYLVEYMDSTGKSIVPYKSSYTPIDTILQSLSSVASCTSVTRMEGNNVVQTKPRVFLIGTFKDKVSEEEINTIDARLQKEIKEHDKDKIVQYADSSQPRLIFTINNLSSDETDIMRIREAVQHLGTDPLTKGDYEITTPYPWLIFGIFVRDFKAPILSYEQCFIIAQECGIDTREELNTVLYFLHTRVGVIQYFRTEDLQDIVIKDPQYIFDRISSLIVETFTFERMPHTYHVPNEFTKRGIFPSHMFVKIAETSNELLTPTKFLSLLKYLHIVVPLEDETSSSNNHTTRYFMPCALSHVEAAQPSHDQQPSIGEPLLIAFESGYTPQGLFGPLISYLLGKKKKSELQWRLIEDKIYRDQITLQLTRQYSVVLRIYPTYLRAQLIQTSSCSESHDITIPRIYNDIRQSLEDGLREISQRLQMYIPHKLAFICPELTHDRCRADIVQDPNGQYLESSQDPAKTWELSDDHHVWLSHAMPPTESCVSHPKVYTDISQVNKYGSDLFDEDTNHPETIPEDGYSTGTNSRGTPASIPLNHPVFAERPNRRDFLLIKWDNNRREESLRLSEEISDSWHDLGTIFGYGTFLAGYREQYLNDPRKCLDAVLGKWLHEGSRPKEAYPLTWAGFIKALDDLHLDMANTLRQVLPKKTN